MRKGWIQGQWRWSWQRRGCLSVQSVHLSRSLEASDQEGQISSVTPASPGVTRQNPRTTRYYSVLHYNVASVSPGVSHLTESSQVVFKLQAIVLGRRLETVSVLGCQFGSGCRLCTAVQVSTPTVWLLHRSTAGIKSYQTNYLTTTVTNTLSAAPSGLCWPQMWIWTVQHPCCCFLWPVSNFCIPCTALEWRHVIRDARYGFFFSVDTNKGSLPASQDQYR